MCVERNSARLVAASAQDARNRRAGCICPPCCHDETSQYVQRAGSITEHNEMNAPIRRAEPSEATALTEIAHEAKRHWDYPEEWIQLWKSVLTITCEFIEEHEVFAVQAGEEIAGFYALVQDSDGDLLARQR